MMISVRLCHPELQTNTKSTIRDARRCLIVLFGVRSDRLDTFTYQNDFKGGMGLKSLKVQHRSTET